MQGADATKLRTKTRSLQRPGDLQSYVGLFVVPFKLQKIKDRAMHMKTTSS